MDTLLMTCEAQTDDAALFDTARTPSPDGSTFIDVYSTRETPQTVVLRDNTGKVIATLAHQDISRLVAAGWNSPRISAGASGFMSQTSS